MYVHLFEIILVISVVFLLLGYLRMMLRCWLLFNFALYVIFGSAQIFGVCMFDPYSRDPTLVVGQTQVWQNYCEPFAGQSKSFSVWDVYFDPRKCQCQNLWLTFLCISMINTTPKPLGNLLDLLDRILYPSIPQLIPNCDTFAGHSGRLPCSPASAILHPLAGERHQGIQSLHQC